jgi:hypothetical protein
MLPDDTPDRKARLPGALTSKTQQPAETSPPPRWWPVYAATLLYVAAVILLLDWLTRHFHP